MGYRIHAIELGERLAALAAANCRRWPAVSISAGAFESFEAPAGHYDLVFSAQAFHWIDPMVRLTNTVRLLSQKGSLALLYNFTPFLEGPLAILNDKLEHETGGRITQSQTRGDIDRWVNELRACKLFEPCQLREYPWQQHYSAEEYIGLFRTYSDYRNLGLDRQSKMADVIRRTIDDSGGSVLRSYVCVLIHARKGG